MKIEIKDEKMFLNTVRHLITAYEYSNKLNGLITFDTIAGSDFMNAPGSALNIMFMGDSEDDEVLERIVDILDNPELNVDQKMNLLFALPNNNIIED